MRFIILTVLSAYIVLAVFARPFPSRLTGEELWRRDSSSCDGQTMKTCATALAPSVATCGLAAAQGELDVVNDAACIGAAVELGKDLPSSCTACVKKFGNGAKTLEHKITSKIKKIF
ncbi:hypothetical protein C8R42DRAFT_681652 [Lentinula raphanica]|nr:hypothetical protein C8R42DRAFT_681652 [Lentinula raphanica]